MFNPVHRTLCLAAGLSAVVALAGCSNFVKRSDYDAAIAKLQQADQSLRATDQSLQQQIDSLTQDVRANFAKYDAKITAMQGRIQVDTVAHFAVNESTLQDDDKPALDGFAQIMSAHHADALVTVEGFADPSGSAAYNKNLGMERAESVRNYLIDHGMAAGQVRAVSYGESRNRQVNEGATGEAGAPNRRASLVIDFAGNQS